MNSIHIKHGLLSSIVLLTGLSLAAPAKAFSLSGFATYGDDMNGMAVTVNYLGGTSQTAIWNTTGQDSGGAFGTGWALSLSGDTFSSPWKFATDASLSQAIASLTINAIPGNTVFDLVPNEPLTDGSGLGLPFTMLSGQAPDSYAYSTDIVGAQADLKGVLSMNWANGFMGLMNFRADTDNGRASDPVQDAAAVPEPTTIAGLALAAAGFVRMRQRQRLVKG